VAVGQAEDSSVGIQLTIQTAKALGAAYEGGSASPVDVVSVALDEIEKTNQRSNWFISILRDSAIRDAEASEKRHRAGNPLGPFDGVPVAVKDILYIRGVKCTAGSKILAENIAPYDATAVRRLRDAGAIIVGTTNLHEFACGVTSENPHYGTVRNPWMEGRTSGGSSGGSAAAVAARLVPVSIGTDTAGSVRIPAALCGTIGVKPTYGRVSRLGVVPLASSLDTVGVLANSAWDAAALLTVLSGHDTDDMTTGDVAVPDFAEEVLARSTKTKVGIPTNYFLDLLAPGVESNLDEFAERLKELGCEVERMKLEGAEEVFDLWAPIRRAEATAFHLRWLNEAPDLYGEDVRKALEAGRDVKAVDYVAAINARPSIIEKFLASMKGFDMLAVPSTCVPAVETGRKEVTVSGKEVGVYHALNRLTLPFNYVGFPATSVPTGLVGGLPVGIQLVSRLFEEGKALNLASRFELEFPFPEPPASSG